MKKGYARAHEIGTWRSQAVTHPSAERGRVFTRLTDVVNPRTAGGGAHMCPPPIGFSQVAEK